MVNLERLPAFSEAHAGLRKCAHCRQMFANAHKNDLLCKCCVERKCLRCSRVFLSAHIGNRLCHGCSGFAGANSSTF